MFSCKTILLIDNLQILDFKYDYSVNISIFYIPNGKPIAYYFVPFIL